MSQFFLRKALCMPQPAKIRSEDLTQIHAPSQACCRLLTHRFKQTKVGDALVDQAAGQNVGAPAQGETALSTKLMCGAAAAFLLFGSAGAHAQPFGSEDEVAAKNVFLAVTGALKCDGLAPVLSRIREYAQQNGVSIDSLRDQAEKYKNQRAYAVTIVDSHAKVGGLASLCKNIIQDFGPDGKLAGGLIAEVRQSAVGSAAVFDGAVPTPEAANPPRPPLRDLWLAAGATPGVLQTRELIALIASVFAVIAGYFSARKRAAEGARGSTCRGCVELRYSDLSRAKHRVHLARAALLLLGEQIRPTQEAQSAFRRRRRAAEQAEG